jgi:glutamate racemase
MKIGVFDSGLGGLFTIKSLLDKLPQYDYVYLGDTKRVPYGNRSHETIYQFLEEAVAYLFKHDCKLIIVACNTASAEALRQIQQKYLPKHYPERRVLGIIAPAAEVATKNPKTKRIGVLATQSTVDSQAFVREIKKIRPGMVVIQEAAPLLVPLIESGSTQFLNSVLRSYLQPLVDKKIDTLILGCTHYPIIKRRIQKVCGPDITILSQNEIISAKLADYLKRHPEIEKKLSKNHGRQFLVTELTTTTKMLAKKWFGAMIKFEIVTLAK